MTTAMKRGKWGIGYTAWIEYIDFSEKFSHLKKFSPNFKSLESLESLD